MHNREIGWNKDNLNSDGSFKNVRWNVTESFNRDCSYHIAFIKKGWSENVYLKIKNVKILVDGTHLVSLPASSDDGDDKFTSFYHFKLNSTIDDTKEVELQDDLAGANGNDYEGTVSIYATEFKNPYQTP